MIGVVAYNYEDALLYARKEDLGKERLDWVSITRPAQARGRRLSGLSITPRAYLNRDFFEIMAAVQPCIR